ncbi:MAG: hypothetical protein RIQ52_1349 [Pseudomonadota bacterium]
MQHTAITAAAAQKPVLPVPKPALPAANTTYNRPSTIRMGEPVIKQTMCPCLRTKFPLLTGQASALMIPIDQRTKI